MRSRGGKGLVFGAAFCLAGTTVPAWDDYFPRPAPGMKGSPAAAEAQPAVPDTIREQGPANDSADSPRTIPGLPGVLPRLVLRNEIRDSAKAAGFPLPWGEAAIYRIIADTGTFIAVAAPVRAGTDQVLILRLMPGGSIRPDTLSLDRIRSIELPAHARSQGLGWMAMAGVLVLPLAISQGVPFHLLAGFQAGIGSTNLMLEWALRPPAEFLDHPYRWNGTVAATLGLALRSSFSPADPRAETVPTFRIQADAGPLWSPLTFGFALRMVSMDSPLNREEGYDSAWTGYGSGRHDRAYAAEPRAIVMGPSVAVVWAESPAYTLRTRAGGYVSLTPYPDRGETLDSRAAGPEFGLELDLRPTVHWALRLETSLFCPIDKNSESLLDPSAGIGLAYAFHARPAPTRAPGVLAAVSTAISGQRFIPGFQLEQDLDSWQSMGLGVAYSRHTESVYRDYPTQGYSWNDTRRWSSSLLFTYGLHTDRSLRVHLGAQLSAGLTSVRTVERAENRFRTFDGQLQTSRYGQRWASEEFAMGLMPEVGVRLGAGIGLRLRLHLVPFDPFASDDDLRASAGFTYALPTGGAGR